jgi:hypothetical protein
MLVPWPSETHSHELGADIWKKISPDPDDAVFCGMLSLKHASPRQTLATCADARHAAICQSSFHDSRDHDIPKFNSVRIVLLFHTLVILTVVDQSTDAE